MEESSREDMQNEKVSGPRTESWKTPIFKGHKGEEKSAQKAEEQ